MFDPGDIGKEIIVNLTTEALKEPAKQIGSELASLLDLMFTPLKMAKICRDAWLDDYKARILQKYTQIPEDRRISPPLEIVGPAIEASRYFIQKEEMREMFANLVAHACDSQNDHAVHPAFVFFLTQMTPLEAEIIKQLRVKTEVKMGTSISVGNEPKRELSEMSGTGVMHYPERYLPVVNYHLESGTQRRTIYRNVIQVVETEDTNAVSAAISNLVRMGLITTTYTEQLADKTYDWASENKVYNELIQYTKNGYSGKGVTMVAIRGHIMTMGQFDHLTIEKGIIHLTQLGYDFMKCCVIEQEVTVEGQ